MPADEIIADLVFTYGPDRVREVSSDILGFPPPMVTSFPEAEKLKTELEKRYGS